MLRQRVMLILLVMLDFRIGQAQVTVQWAACYNGPANDWDAAAAVAVDDSGFVYVTGGSPGIGTGVDYATIKYDSNGIPLWVRRYNRPTNGFDVARDIKVDRFGNVLVTGAPVTIKYSPGGIEMWASQNGAEGIKIAISADDHIYVAGTGFGDFVTNKFDTSGALQWRRIYDGGGSDRAHDLAIDSKGNVVVAGQSEGASAHWDYATVKYSPYGDTLWVKRYNGPAPTFPGDYAYAITVDDSDNVYVTGWSDGANERPQCFTIKYGPDGDSLWSHRYPSGGSLGYAGYDIAYNPHGFIYVVARSNGYNDTVLKYDLQGNLIWSAIYVTDHTFTPDLARIALDTAGNVYLLSHNSVANVHSDFVVVKLSTNGGRLWEYKYPGGQQPMSNTGRALTLDKSGNLYVAGESHACPPGGFNYLTLKLTQDPTSVGELPNIPYTYALQQNYPNPFNPSTTIAFSLPTNALVSLKVFDLLGRGVATIVSEELPAGKYSREWLAAGLPSGVYFYKMQASHFSQTRKLILLR